MSRYRSRIGILFATVGAAALLFTGCAAPAPGGDAGGTPDTAEAGDSPPAPSDSDSVEAAGEIDCVAVGDTLIAWLDASFAGMSTEITNGEVAAKYAAAAEAFDATSAPGADQWDDLGAVIDEYVAQWSALPADGGAIENIETIEAHVDAFAEGRGFDNDDFEDMTPIVGEACAGELEDVFEG